MDRVAEALVIDRTHLNSALDPSRVSKFKKGMCD